MSLFSTLDVAAKKPDDEDHDEVDDEDEDEDVKEDEDGIGIVIGERSGI